MNTLRTISLCLPFLLLLTLAGCGGIKVVITNNAETKLLTEGQEQFKAGHYNKAEQIFNEAYVQATRIQVKNTALFNLTCTKILLAKDYSEFKKEMTFLEKWMTANPGFIYMDTPNIVLTSLSKREEERMEYLKKLVTQSNGYRATISKQKEELAELNEQVELLQSQIDKLEAIDHELMEKKKPL